ncbi:hypothetical protein M1349_05715 [Patescibacteria group bacterium]|nr:hypothetical protein [Patescibacteria group bacterium]
MDEIMLRQLQDILTREFNIGIITGKNPSVDDMGAALALFLSLSASGKNVSIVSPTDPIVELSSLIGINKVKNRFAGISGDLVVSFPYKEGEIDKVSYTLEDGFLNIVVKEGELGLSFNQKDIRYSRSAGIPKVVIVVGSPRLSDLTDILDPAQMKDITVVNIDNSSDNQGYGDIVLVSQKLSSVSEAIANIIQNLGLTLDKDIAQNLLSGISSATENFQNQNTSPLAFEMTAALIKQGAVRSIGRRQPQDVKTPFDFGVPLKPQTQPVIEQKEAQRESNQETKEDPFVRLQKKLDEMKAKQKQEVSEETKKESKQENAPSMSEGAPDDWLTPKIYKGSTNF